MSTCADDVPARNVRHAHRPRTLLAPIVSASRSLRSFTVQITALTLLSLAGAYLAAFFLGTPMPTMSQKYVGLCIFGLILVAGLSLLGYTVALIASGEQRPIPKVWARASSFATPSMVVEKLVPILLVFAFLGAFTQLKALIPRVHPFAWDGAASNLDRMIFGTDPWRLTHAVIGPLGTRVVDAIYLLWFPVLTCVVFYNSVFAPAEQKRRFFLSYFGLWIILGLVAATIFSSAGPCFLELVGGPYRERYAGLFPTSAASQAVMDRLAWTYTSGQLGIGTGISAMPSLHVGFAFLYVLAAARPATRVLAWAYFLIILIGSVHLGWHYAVDGLFAVAGTWLIYRMTSFGSQERSASVSAFEVVRSRA